MIFVQFSRGTSTSLDAISDSLAGPYSVAAAARSDGGVFWASLHYVKFFQFYPQFCKLIVWANIFSARRFGQQTSGQPKIFAIQLGNKCSKKNNIKYLEKWEIFFRFAYLSAVWLQFGQNSIEIINEKNCALYFSLIVTKQLINKQNWKIFLISPNI